MINKQRKWSYNTLGMKNISFEILPVLSDLNFAVKSCAIVEFLKLVDKSILIR
jgi:hypothetical protein